MSKRDAPGQTWLFPAEVLPRGDGSYVVVPGRPQEWLWVRDAARLAGLSPSAMLRWAMAPGSPLVSRRAGRRKYQIEAASLRRALEPHNYAA